MLIFSRREMKYIWYYRKKRVNFLFNLYLKENCRMQNLTFSLAVSHPNNRFSVFIIYDIGIKWLKKAF